MKSAPPTSVPPAAGVPYYTPAQTPPAGTFLAEVAPASKPPTLFTPLKIRSVTLPNRLAVSPMCMYSAQDGHLSDFHLVHLGQFAMHGTGLTMVEATSVEARGRISPEDSGIYSDSHVPQLRRIADFIRSQGHLSGIQLAHAGRKASTLPPWVSMARNAAGSNALKASAQPDEGGWPEDVIAPSAIPFGEGYAMPKAMTLAEIDALVDNFVAGAKRALAAGFDVIEIHGAHGYLINEFLSPLSNQRTDDYGGSFENRTRLLFRVIRAVRAVVPETMPVFVRLSATEWMDHAHPEPESSLDLATTIRIAKLLYAEGVDLLDVSSGGNNSAQQIPHYDRYQADLASKIRAALRAEGGDAAKLLISTVGRITTAQFAKELVEETEEKPADADLVFAGKQFLRDPAWVLNIAKELNVPVSWPTQYHLAAPKH